MTYEQKRDDLIKKEYEYSLESSCDCCKEFANNFKQGADWGYIEGKETREREIFETLNRMSISFDVGMNEAVIAVRDHLKKCLEVDDKER